MGTTTNKPNLRKWVVFRPTSPSNVKDHTKLIKTLNEFGEVSERCAVSVETMDSQLLYTQLQALIRMICDCQVSMYKPIIYIGVAYVRTTIRSRKRNNFARTIRS